MHIVTHPGKSHTDDRMSVSLILAQFGMMPVYRREPTENELNDANVFVIDIGMKYEPVLRNFDHHQLPAEHSPECALSLLIKSGIFGSKITQALIEQPWLGAVAMIDSKGPGYYCENNSKGILPHFPYDLESPAELALQWQFERSTSHNLGYVDDIVCDQLYQIGAHLVERALHEKKHLDKLLQSTQFVKAGKLVGFVAQVEDRRINERFALELHKPPLDFAIYPSIRGPGWRVTRMSDEVPIDFYQVVDDPRVEFAHVNGFTLATKKKISLEELVELIEESTIEVK